MFKRLRQFFIRRKNNKKFTFSSKSSKYFSPAPAAVSYKKCFDFPPEPKPSTICTPKMSLIKDSTNFFKSDFELSHIPTYKIRSSGWQSSRPYSQNAKRFQFYGSSSKSKKNGNNNHFRSSKCSSQGSSSQATSSRKVYAGSRGITWKTSTPKKPSTQQYQETPRRRVPLKPTYLMYQRNLDFFN